MNKFNQVAQRVIAFENSHLIDGKSDIHASILGPNAPATVYILWDNNKRSCIMDFERAREDKGDEKAKPSRKKIEAAKKQVRDAAGLASIAVNLLNTGSAREAMQSIKRSGGSDPLEGGPLLGLRW